MSHKASKFCDSVHDKLGDLQGRIDTLRSNIGTTEHSLHEKLHEVRHKGESSKHAIKVARANLEQWLTEKKTEAKSTIDQWVENRETQKLAARAQKAEDGAWTAIVIAQASIDDAERMVLEAIAAWRNADAVTVD